MHEKVLYNSWVFYLGQNCILLGEPFLMLLICLGSFKRSFCSLDCGFGFLFFRTFEFEMRAALVFLPSLNSTGTVWIIWSVWTHEFRIPVSSTHGQGERVSCSVICNPIDCSPPSSSVHGILQARILEWGAIPFSRGSFWPRDQTQVSCIAGRFFTIWATGETHKAFSTINLVFEKDFWRILIMEEVTLLYTQYSVISPSLNTVMGSKRWPFSRH